MIVPSTPLDELVAQMRVYRAALGSRVPDCFPIVRECYVGANHKTAVEECRAALQYKYDAYASWGLSGRADTRHSRNLHATASSSAIRCS